jgi:hypothetical protein
MEFNIRGSLTARDRKQHLTHNFTVPEGASQLDIHFEYGPKHEGHRSNLLTLGLSDPVSDRGTAHRGQASQDIRINAKEATPGFLPGKLNAGIWRLVIDVHWINPHTIVTYDVKVVITTPDAQRELRWYRGDLHGHTMHSDGHWGIDGLLDFARRHQLDFVTLTDHNTIAGLHEMDCNSSDELLTMGGFELTTFHGHALALGIRQMVDWRVTPRRPMKLVKTEIDEIGGLFVIAHPKAPGEGYCTGCRWEYQDLMPSTARAVEVWNEEWGSMSNNEAAVQLWYQWLNQGYHIYATVGTDIHGPRDEVFGFNIVYAEAHSETAILDAVRQGHHYLSSGPRIELTGESSHGYSGMMGDSLRGDSYTIAANWDKCCVGDKIRFIVNGETADTLDAQLQSGKTWNLSGNRWCLIEIRDTDNNMRALTNPIFME